MNTLSKFLGYAFFIAARCAWADDTDDGASSRQEAPTMDEVIALENAIVMPQGAEPLHAYRRYYAIDPYTTPGIIGGEFVLSLDPGISIVARNEFPAIFDGGCSIVHVRYSRAEKKITVAICSGIA